MYPGDLETRMGEQEIWSVSGRVGIDGTRLSYVTALSNSPVWLYSLLFISGCTAYDVVINPAFYNKIQNSELFKSFFLTIVFEGLESKYDIKLDRNWTVLKNKKCMGILQPHFIRSKSKPVIMEMDDENQSVRKQGRTASVYFTFLSLFCSLHRRCYIPLVTSIYREFSVCNAGYFSVVKKEQEPDSHYLILGLVIHVTPSWTLNSILWEEKFFFKEMAIIIWQ